MKGPFCSSEDMLLEAHSDSTLSRSSLQCLLLHVDRLSAWRMKAGQSPEPVTLMQYEVQACFVLADVMSLPHALQNIALGYSWACATPDLRSDVLRSGAGFLSAGPDEGPVELADKAVQQAQRIQGAQVGRLAQESHQVLQRTLQRQLVTQPLDHAGPPIVFYI